MNGGYRGWITVWVIVCGWNAQVAMSDILSHRISVWTFLSLACVCWSWKQIWKEYDASKEEGDD